ncbi:MAG TPA: SIS domain-containing protein [Bryobacteraceae bacterium]|nr:SIS domain-containing protein [Bryobacteraceae bacterium]
MTKLREDILLEPATMEACLNRLLSQSKAEIEAAARLVSAASRVLVVGIGSSWNASLAVCAAFERTGIASQPWDASELLHFGGRPAGAVAVVLSRSGRSVEVVRLLDRFQAEGCPVIGVTNTPDSPLGTRADVVLRLEARFDHMVSVSMYTGLVLGGYVIDAGAGGKLAALGEALGQGFRQAGQMLDGWSRQIAGSAWLSPASPAYFLARGGSLASAQEARLLWEEAAKAPATALTTGGFRHGPQEMVRPGLCVALWVDAETLREPDLQLAADLRSAGACVLLIGQNLPSDAADLVLNLPSVPAAWQPAVDIIPVQLAAERLAGLRAENCDAFRYCPYIVDYEGGLHAGKL